ncbi:MAG: OB-fold domain-containing protein, partial [Candidatus Hermodarchaeota archaeon]|nr:OB-fold domain-containing protein [Candidatus Hermodarchaeota archaeon]
ELDDWKDMGTVGEVFTFTLLFEDLDGTPIEEPIVVAFILMGDGGLVHQLGELDLEELYIGMPVEAVFKPKAEREGSILDIEYFRPITE